LRELLWIVPSVPALGFLILALRGSRLPRTAVAWIGVGSIGISAFAAILIAINFLSSPPEGNAITQVLWTWINVGGLTSLIAFRLDALSLVMMVVVAFVSFLIHLYSSEFMIDDEGYSRFFAYMNLFVASMLVLVLADNLLLLYLGWEGVGLCSYLLIGFWYNDPANSRAAIKAFVVTRVGDAAMAVGLFLLFSQLGTLNIQALMQRASEQWPTGSGLAVAAAMLLLGGAVGKSAQLPLQTWLPDAMAGPTPVSALIHAATMVTAGVYLIARTNVIFALAPAAQTAVAIIGALTLLLAGFSALTQRDIKRVLAYSTISQIGYMFLALGVAAYSAAIFHFMTHAFFKALLFLGAGVLINGLHHEHDMFKMGGMRRQFPVTFWTFLIAGASLSAFPIITAGFYSKDLIIWSAWSSKIGSPWLWLAGIAGAFITAIYTFRMIFVTFFGESKTQAEKMPGGSMEIPLVALAVLSIASGFVELPDTMGHFTPFSDFMHSVMPDVGRIETGTGIELVFQLISMTIVFLGIYLAYALYMRNRKLVTDMTASPGVAALRRFWFSGWGFDWLYDRAIVRPFVWVARTNKNDVIDLIYSAITLFNQALHLLLSWTQTGKVRLYAAAIALGAIITVAIVVFS
jgi:NADH-quinone oxidoreductase subunit L